MDSTDEWIKSQILKRVLHRLWLLEKKNEGGFIKYFFLSYDRIDGDPKQKILDLIDDLDGVPLVYPAESSIIFYSYSSEQNIKYLIGNAAVMKGVHYALYCIGYDLDVGLIKEPVGYPNDDNKPLRKHYSNL